MSEKIKKTVKITEKDLVDLIDNILNESIEIKKTEWLNEQASEEKKKFTLLEEKINKLETTIKELAKAKK